MIVSNYCTNLPSPRKRRSTPALSPVAVLFAVSVISSLLIATGHCSPINRQAGISENVYITVQNDTYGNEHRVCSIESMTYEDGESIPTSSPCEHCICRPPGFACTIISCDYRPGCKALKRSNQCCPEYQCECEKDGKIYQNGEKILDDNNPCEVCYCQGGDVVCAVIDCYWRSDCQPRYIENRCCPLYDHCPPPTDLGPIMPTARPTTTTTTQPPISWFNVSQAVEASSPKPLLPFTSTTQLTPISEPEFAQHVVLIPTPVEQSPAENNVQGSGEQGSNEVPQGSQEQELTQIIIQPNESSEQPQQPINPAAEQSVPVSTEPPIVVPVPEVPTESSLPVVAEGVSPVPAVSSSETPSEGQDRTPEPQVVVAQEPIQQAPVSPADSLAVSPAEPEVVSSTSETPVEPTPSDAPSSPSVIYSEIEQGNEVVPPEIHPVVVVEPSETVSSSAFVEPSSSPVASPGETESSEVNVESFAPTSSTPQFITESQTQEQETFTLSSQQIITITPTRSFMTELLTETVVYPSASGVSVPQPEPTLPIIPSVTSAVVEPSAVLLPQEPAPGHETTEAEVAITTEAAVNVPPVIELQVSVDVIADTPVTEAQSAATEFPAVPEAVQDPVPAVEFETPVITTESSSAGAAPTIIPSQQELESADDPVAHEGVTPDEKIVIIETQPIVPATSPPEIVTTSFPEDVVPDVVDDDKGAGLSEEIVPEQEEKIVVIESQPVEPATSSPEDSLPSTVLPPQEEKIVVIESQPVEPATSSPDNTSPATVVEPQEEKIVVIESQPIVPAISPPEVITTVQPQEEEFVDNKINDGVPEENAIEFDQLISSTASPVVTTGATSPQSLVHSTEDPTTQSVLFQENSDDTVEIWVSEVLHDAESPKTTVQPISSLTEGVTNAPVAMQPPSWELQPPLHDFQPRPEEENEIPDEVLVSDEVKPQGPVSLSQVEPMHDDNSHQHQQRPTAIFDPPLNILYVPAQDALPTTASDRPNTEAPGIYNDGTTEAFVNDLVFESVQSIDDQPLQDQPSEGATESVVHDEVIATTQRPISENADSDVVVHDESVPPTTARPASAVDNEIFQDEPELLVHDEITTVPPPIADREEDTIEIALADDVDSYSVQTTVLPPAISVNQLVTDEPKAPGFDDEVAHDGADDATTVISDIHYDEDVGVLGLQHDAVDPLDDDSPTTPQFVNDDTLQHDEVLSGTAASPTEEPVQSDSTDSTPGPKYRLDLSGFDDTEGSGVAPLESVTVGDIEHNLVHADEQHSTLPPELTADNVVVFDEPNHEHENKIVGEVTTNGNYANAEILSDSGSGDGTDQPPSYRHHHPDHIEGSGDDFVAVTNAPSSLSRHHHPDHVDGSGDDTIPTTDVPSSLSRHHHPDHVEGSGSGDDATVFEDEPASTTNLPNYENEIVQVPLKVKSRLPKIPPHLVKPVAPISPDMVESFSRAEHSVQSEAEAEVARADESWFWRTFNKIMTLPDYLRSSRRPRRSADLEDVNTAKIFHKKDALKQLKKVMGDPSDKKYKEWSTFPRFLLW